MQWEILQTIRSWKVTPICKNVLGSEKWVQCSFLGNKPQPLTEERAWVQVTNKKLENLERLVLGISPTTGYFTSWMEQHSHTSRVKGTRNVHWPNNIVKSMQRQTAKRSALRHGFTKTHTPKDAQQNPPSSSHRQLMQTWSAEATSSWNSHVCVLQAQQGCAPAGDSTILHHSVNVCPVQFPSCSRLTYLERLWKTAPVLEPLSSTKELLARGFRQPQQFRAI